MEKSKRLKLITRPLKSADLAPRNNFCSKESKTEILKEMLREAKSKIRTLLDDANTRLDGCYNFSLLD